MSEISNQCSFNRSSGVVNDELRDLASGVTFRPPPAQPAHFLQSRLHIRRSGVWGRFQAYDVSSFDLNE